MCVVSWKGRGEKTTDINFVPPLLNHPHFPSRLPRSLMATPLRNGDDILEINGVPIVDQDQKEVN